MTVDVKVAEKMLVFAPDIRIWSARTKLRTEDFADGAKDLLPPSDIADLGTKRLIDSEKLRPFAMLKSRAVSLLSRIGIPFLPGSWLVPADKGSEIHKELEAIKHDFDDKKETFLADLDATCADWISLHPEHEAMLRSGMASPDYVRSRISFGWRAFALRMTRNSNIRDEMENLGNSIFADISKEASVVRREVFMDRETVTQRALNPIRNLAGKLRGLAFVHPLVAHAAYLTQSCLEAMPSKGNIEGKDLGMIMALLTLLADPAALEEATLRMAKDKAGPETLLMPSPPAAADPVPVPGRTMITNVGLW